MIDLQLALQAAIRQGEHNAQALIDTALVVRDLKTAIRAAIEAIDRKSYETARQELKHQGLARGNAHRAAAQALQVLDL